MQNIRDFLRSKRLLLLFPLVLFLIAGALVILNDGNDGRNNDASVDPGPGTEVLGEGLENPQQALGIPSGQAPRPDRQPPAVALSFPRNATTYGAAAWTGGCSPTGICGTASDPSGVAKVELSIRQQASGRHWNGTAFNSSAPVFHQAAGTTSWNYPFGQPADGSYTVSVRATDTLGHTSGLRTATWTVDTSPPVVTVIVRHPDDVTFDTSAEFGFDHPEAGVTFRCQLDTAAPAACGRNVTFRGLDANGHTLKVWAVDAAGNEGPPTSFSWIVAPRRDFVISNEQGEVGPENLLAPGRTVALDAVVSNPFNFAIEVIDVSVTVTGATKNGQPNPACSTSENLEVTNSAFAGKVVIPANSSRSLSDLGVPSDQWPQLSMVNLPTNQDACKSTTFQLSYQGTGTKS